MKRVTIIATLFSIALIYGCSSSKNIGSTSLPDPKPENTETAAPKAEKKSSKSSQKGVVVKDNTTIDTETTSAPDTKPTTTSKTSKTASSEKVVVKEEHVQIIQEVGNPIEPGKYYVIMGSFRVVENAQSFKTHLIVEHYNPILLQNDEGLYRVAVGAYLQEAPAREKINTIRSQSDKYNDVWLLIQKN